MKLERVKTGIAGLDEMLKGGLIANRPYIVSGKPGSGKTIMAMQFLIEGTKNQEKSLYISLEEGSEELYQNMSVFNWDLQSIKIIDTYQEMGSDRWLIKTDNLVSMPELSVENLLKYMKDRIETYKPKRIVIDSMTSLKMLYEKDYDTRRGLLMLMNFLFKSDVTALITSIGESDNLMEESLASGSLRIEKIEERGETIQGIKIEKMRGSDFDKHLRPMKITKDGIKVFQNESIYN